MDWARPLQVLMAMTATLLLTSSSALGAASEIDPDPTGYMLDVRLVPVSCLTGDNCTIVQPTHLIEYFSADWCEPCEQVTQELENLTVDGVLMLQHHPSPADETFLSASKSRFELTYRLLFLPSLVVDGTQLLTGARQAMDLPATLNSSNLSSGSLSGLTAHNTTLAWPPSEAGVVRAWYADATPHATNGKIHASLARNVLEANASEGTMNLSSIDPQASGFLVVMHETNGTRSLNVASLSPTGSMDLSEQDTGPSPVLESAQPSWLIGLATLALVVLLLPAFAMHRGLMKDVVDDAPLLRSAEE